MSKFKKEQEVSLFWEVFIKMKIICMTKEEWEGEKTIRMGHLIKAKQTEEINKAVLPDKLFVFQGYFCFCFCFCFDLFILVIYLLAYSVTTNECPLPRILSILQLAFYRIRNKPLITWPAADIQVQATQLWTWRPGQLSSACRQNGARALVVIGIIGDDFVLLRALCAFLYIFASFM